MTSTRIFDYNGKILAQYALSYNYFRFGVSLYEHYSIVKSYAFSYKTFSINAIAQCLAENSPYSPFQEKWKHWRHRQ